MKVIILGGGSDQITLIEKVKHDCSDIILVDYYDNPPARPYATRHYKTSTLDVDAVEAVAKHENVDRIITACIDQALLTGAIVSERLNLPFYISHRQALEVTHKTLMKQRFVELGIQSPRYHIVNNDSTDIPEHLKYPVIVKPADRNGSMGVTLAYNSADVIAAVTEALTMSRSRSVVIEEFVEGTELSVDVYVNNSEVHILLVTVSHKLPNQAGFAIQRSIYPAPLSHTDHSAIHGIVTQIASGFGITNGPMIVQLIHDQEGFHVLEFGARIAGGSKHHFLKRTTGFDVMQAFVDMTFGRMVEVNIQHLAKWAAMTYVYCHPGRFHTVTGLETSVSSGFIDSWNMYKTPGMEIEGHFASRDRPMSYCTVATSKEELHARLLSAEESIHIIDNNGNDLTLRSGVQI